MSEFQNRIRKSAEDARRVFKLASVEPFAFNQNYRLTYDDTIQLLTFAEQAQATSGDVRQWYANGPECRDRPCVLATFHPVIHKHDDGWRWIIETAITLAKDLKRWIWVTLGEDRWVRIMVGDDPRKGGEEDDETGPLYVDGKYQNDQYITTFSPTGEEHFVGCS